MFCFVGPTVKEIQFTEIENRKTENNLIEETDTSEWLMFALKNI